MFKHSLLLIILFYTIYPVESSGQIGLRAMPQKQHVIVADSTPILRFSLAHPTIMPVLPANYSTSCYGFFCRQELKLDKAIKVPVRFRMGSMQQSDWLEGKGNSIYPLR